MAYDNSYSRLVTGLKIVMPLIALGILSTLFLVSESVDPSRAIPFTDIDVDELAREQGIGEPSYTGVTNSGVAFSVTATSASPNFKGDRGVSALNIRAEMETKDGATYQVVANSGTFENKTKLAVFQDEVTIVTSDGYRIVTDTLNSSFDMSEIETHSPITAEGPFGRLTAGKMVLTQRSEKPGESDYLLVFTNGVNLIYEPQKGEAGNE